MHPAKGYLQRSDQLPVRSVPGKEDRLAASMTLGKGVDELQEKLQEQDMLLESYMVETLAGEALMEAYSRFHAEIHRRTGWFVKQMSFWEAAASRSNSFRRC